MTDAVLHQVEERFPGFRRVHAADDALAVAEPVLQNDRADPRIDAGRVHGNARAQASIRTARCGWHRPRGVTPCRSPRCGRPDTSSIAITRPRSPFAVAAAAIVEAQRDIAPGFELLADPFRAAALVGAKAVHHDDGRSAFAGSARSGTWATPDSAKPSDSERRSPARLQRLFFCDADGRTARGTVPTLPTGPLCRHVASRETGATRPARGGRRLE